MTQKELLQTLVTEMTEEQATQLLNIFYIINPMALEDEELSQEELQAITDYQNGVTEFVTEDKLHASLGAK